MKRQILFVLALCGVITLQSQDIDYLRTQADRLASPDMYGRGYVNDGLDRAAQHIELEYKRLGLKPVNGSYRQAFKHPVNVFPGRMHVDVDGRKLVAGADYLVDPASPSLQGEFTVDRLCPKPSTKIPKHKNDRKNHNVVKVIDIRQLSDTKIKRAWRTYARALTENMPVMLITGEKLTWAVANTQLNFPLIEVKDVEINRKTAIMISIEAKLDPAFESENIIGVIPGSSDSMIVFTAHYDHLGMMGPEAVFYGANDNASGTAYILSLAKYYMEHPPEYTCVFIAFAGEEAGLLGSRHFVEQPLIDLGAIRYLINIDLMGSGVDGITVVNAPAVPELFDMMQGINEEHAYLPLIKSRNQAANSDHYFFAEAGVPAVFIYALGGSQAYHDIYDVSSNLTFEEYPDIFRLITALVANY